MSKRSGFTLIEVLVTVLVIGVLAAIAVPYYQTAVDKSRFSSLMPIAKTVKDAQESFWLERGGQYSNDLGLLATSVTREAHGTTATLGDVTVTINNDREYSYVKTNKPSLNNNYVYYQDHSVNYPGEIHCEALQENDRAARVCKSQDGQKISGGLTEGYDTYVIKGQGNGIPFSMAEVVSSSGGWQSCDTYPCTKTCARETPAGYTCNGTYNDDHTYSEMVCVVVRAGQQICTKKAYDENGNLIRRLTCELGDGEICVVRAESTYDEYGNMNSFRECNETDDEGRCIEYGWGRDLVFDANGNVTGEGDCEEFANDGSCTAYSYYSIYTYDANGNPSTSLGCQTFAPDGSCSEYNYGEYYTFTADGNETSVRFCEVVASDGTCSSYSWGADYMFDEHGRQTAERPCYTVASDGTCEEYGYGQYLVYDENGRVTSARYCNDYAADGTCAQYNVGGPYSSYDGVYDEYGNQILTGYCATLASDGTCTSYSQIFASTYDENGHKLSSRRCQTFTADGSCIAYDDRATFFSYDENGNVTSDIGCNVVGANGTCSQYSYANYFTYDEYGNETSRYSCSQFNSNGTCEQWNNRYEYLFDEEGHAMGYRECRVIASDGKSCLQYSHTVDYTNDEDGEPLFGYGCFTNTDGEEECYDEYY